MIAADWILLGSFVAFIYFLNLAFKRSELDRVVGGFGAGIWFCYMIAVACVLLSSCSSVHKTKNRSRQSSAISERTHLVTEMENRTQTLLRESVDTNIVLPGAAQQQLLPYFDDPARLFPGLIRATLRLDSLNMDLSVTVDTINKTMNVQAKQHPKTIPVKKTKELFILSEQKEKRDSTGSRDSSGKKDDQQGETKKEPDSHWRAALVILIVMVIIFVFSPVLPRRK